MTHPSCDRCDLPATVHETVVGASGIRQRHYCREHGLALWHDALPPLNDRTQAEFLRWIKESCRRAPRDQG